MKKVITTLVLAMISFTCVMAQGNFDGQRRQRQRMNPQEMMEQRTKQMVERYNLNEEQAQALAALNKEMMQPSRNQEQGNDSARANRPQRREGAGPQNGERRRGEGGNARQGGNFRQRNWGAASNAYNEKLKQIMTPEQYAQYEKDMQQMRERMRAGGMR